ncbi:MAG: Uma2 family endonuclease [Thermodesulfobacteriota bacterium]
MLATMASETSFRSEERFTQEQFFQWIQERPARDRNHYELIGGRIVMSPPAGWPHSEIEVKLAARLQLYCERTKAGRAQGSSAGYDLPSGDTLEPDVSFISRERFAAGPAPQLGRFIRIVPNLAIEIMSRSSVHRDRVEKKEIYQRCGVDEYWIVDPVLREITVFALVGGRYDEGTTFTSGRVASPLLPELEVVVEDVFDED